MGRSACPAVRTLDQALRTTIPFLGGNYVEVNGKNSGRLQVSGNPRHQLGVCLDIILFSMPWGYDKSVDYQDEKKLAENIVQAFVDLKEIMKWTEIILQDRLFWEPEYYRHYGADIKHFTHIHIDWMTNSLKGNGKSDDEIITNSPQANTTEFYASLTGRLTDINNKHDQGQLSSIDLATIMKTYSPTVNPIGDWRVTVAQWSWIYSFDADGNVSWRDPYNNQTGKGKWQVLSGAIVMTWFNSTTTESWNLPIQPTNETGRTTMKGTTYPVNAVRL